MGDVYRAESQESRSPVAIKVLRAEVARDPLAVARFVQEARLMETLVHRHILRVHRSGTESGSLYLVTEWIDGGSLSDKLLREGTLPLKEARLLVSQIIEGLSHAADRGVTHRDVKPANILLKWGTDVKISDFGIAKFLGADNRQSAGLCVGSPYYMSPEQALGLDSDLRSDIYSLGITFYQMLTGEVPFTGRDAAALMKQHVLHELPEPPGLSRLGKGALLPLLRNMTAKNPAERHQSYDELLFAVTQLASVDESEPALPVPRSRAKLVTRHAEHDLEQDNWGPDTLAAPLREKTTRAQQTGGEQRDLASFHELPTLLEIPEGQDAETREAAEVIRAGATLTVTSAPAAAANIGKVPFSVHHAGNEATPLAHQLASSTRAAVDDAVKGGRSAVRMAAVLVLLALVVVLIGARQSARREDNSTEPLQATAKQGVNSSERHRRAAYQLVQRKTAPPTASTADIPLGMLAADLQGRTPPEVVQALGVPDFKEVAELHGELHYDATQWSQRIVDETSAPVARLQVLFQQDRVTSVVAFQ